ncbi:segregation and condensation protein A [Lactobacillus intestinalis]|uniref:Segregation and condensation protein A n=1 Tax=Lactobacillus intestinalis DSM 6629 TaxID=1423761 RepID=A0ABR5PQ64_9LACO|nr:segregation/condensation protein A [Lactobacillus intestinalis]KRM32141.1 hypothetical protein FC44_GL000159 [Lactobacillus intestinalis DSM 6629]UTW39677.1 segregation/condensation protein A [Lactobacillus intestinalis]
MNKDLTLELPNFEGPLDLLLHLIQSQEINIYDIPIAQITSQYLDYLKQMQQLNLQIAGEYFVMSSTLLRIKSQYLLPQNDFVENVVEEDPRDELVQQLVQYSVFKKISEYFKQRNDSLPVTVSKEASVSKDKKLQKLPLGQISSDELAHTFAFVMRKLKIKHPDSAMVEVKERSITEMCSYLKNKVSVGKEVSFFSCINELSNISDVIGLFLAVLELSKNKDIIVTQSITFGDLNIKGINKNGH